MPKFEIIDRKKKSVIKSFAASEWEEALKCFKKKGKHFRLKINGGI